MSRKQISLETLTKKELMRLKRHELLDLLSSTIKSEAYDDSPIDNAYVAKLEQQVPGIITAYSGNHNFSNATPEENHRVVMEAIDSGRALKAGIIAAILLLVFKVFSVMMNNKDFGVGGGAGGGGRGTTTGAKQQNETVHTATVETVSTLQEATELLRNAHSNPVNNEDDSPLWRASQALVNTMHSGPVDEEGKPNNPYTEAMQEQLTFSKTQIPVIMLVKDKHEYDVFEEAMFSLVELLADDNSKAGLVTFMEQMVLLNRILATSSIGDLASLKQTVLSHNVRGGLDSYLAPLATHFKLNSQPHSVNDEVGGKSIASAARELATLVEKSLSPLSSNQNANILSDKEILEDLQKDPSTTAATIYYRNVNIGAVNDIFLELIEKSGHGMKENSSIITQLLETILISKEHLKEAKHSERDENLTDEDINMLHTLLVDIEGYIDVYTKLILKPVFNGRTRIDKLTVFLDDIYDQLESVKAKADKVIDIAKSNEGI